MFGFSLLRLWLWQAVQEQDLIVVYVEVEPLVFFAFFIHEDEIYLSRPPFCFNTGLCGDVSMVHLAIKVGAQPFPRRKRTNLNVSVSLAGFFQKISRISLGQRFKGKNASPSITFINFLLSSTTSSLDKSEISSR